ncbi:homologous-pairing protein 2 homolog [Nilaparvata lugens]|uniref:homologous-pairing protein 2 homolog n=1 Tax=Nilaparvata lugens TaxID=108931 RepID=UPI00193EA0BC|nr:homologous-pairing protein 2 homolog [Nilaparvata lugens]
MANKAVLNYLATTNRPYSSTDITLNLHKEFGKTAIQKALDQLAEEGKVREKTYGKQKVYAIILEDNLNNEDESKEKEALDAEILRLSSAFKNVERETKQSEAELQGIVAQPTNEQAKPKIVEIETRISDLRSKIKSVSEDWNDESEKRMKVVKEERAKYVKEYRKRKRMCMDILNAIMEGYQGSKKTLMEEIGIETDEDVAMPPVLQ